METMRSRNGRFAPGNGGGPGRPVGSSTGNTLRGVLLSEITSGDIRACVRCLRGIIRGKARPSDKLAAITILLDRAIGKPLPCDIETEIAELKKSIKEIVNEQNNQN